MKNSILFAIMFVFALSLNAQTLRMPGPPSAPVFVKQGKDPVNHSLDSKMPRNGNFSNAWKLPAPGKLVNIELNYSLKNKKNVGWVKLWYNPNKNEWLASSQVPNWYIENFRLVAESKTFWIFTCFNSIFGETYKGFDLYLAKDYSCYFISNHPELLYCVPISERYYYEIRNTNTNIEPVGSERGPSEMRRRGIQAQTEALAAQNKASIEAAIKQCEANIEAINRGQRPNNSKTSSQNSGVRMTYYGPDYTGGQYVYWCDECKGWGPSHTHYTVR